MCTGTGRISSQTKRKSSPGVRNCQAKALRQEATWGIPGTEAICVARTRLETDNDPGQEGPQGLVVVNPKTVGGVRQF